MKIEISPTARHQLGELVAWWDEHRPSARVRVEDAFEAALDALLRYPARGVTYDKRPRYRTLLLKGTPYSLFYRVERGDGGTGAGEIDREPSPPFVEAVASHSVTLEWA
jgi:plasmid stabilization system protein ParE